MSLAIRLFPEPIRSLAFGSIGGSFAAVGAPIAHPSSIFMMQNGTDVELFFSLDGIHDHFLVPSNSFILFDLVTNRTLSQGAFFAQGTQVYVAQGPAGAPTVGSAFVTTVYGLNGNG